MKVIEHLFEFHSCGFDVRMWIEAVKEPLSFTDVRRYADSWPPDYSQQFAARAFAEHLAKYPRTNAVQVTYSVGCSMLVYPDWP